MNITIDEKLTSTLERLAAQRNVTTEQYVTDYISSHLLSQYKAHISEIITTKKLPDLVTMETAVVAIDESIKERDSAPPEESEVINE